MRAGSRSDVKGASGKQIKGRVGRNAGPPLLPSSSPSSLPDLLRHGRPTHESHEADLDRTEEPLVPRSYSRLFLKRDPAARRERTAMAARTTKWSHISPTPCPLRKMARTSSMK